MSIVFLFVCPIPKRDPQGHSFEGILSPVDGLWCFANLDARSLAVFPSTFAI